MRRRLLLFSTMLIVIMGCFAHKSEAQEDAMLKHKVTTEDLRFAQMIEDFHNSRYDSTKLRILRIIAQEHYNTDSTLKYALMLRDFAISIGDRKHESYALRFIAWVNYYEEKSTDCCANLYEAIRISESIQDTVNLMKSYSLLADALSGMRNEVQADVYYHKALSYALSIGDHRTAASIYRNIAHTAIENRAYSQAQKCIEEALNHALIIQDSTAIAGAHYYRGYIEFSHTNENAGNPSGFITALTHFNHALETYRNNESLEDVQRTLRAVADCWNHIIKHKAYSNRDAAVDSSMTAIEESGRLCETMGYSGESLVDVALTKSELFILTHKSNEARRMLELADSALRFSASNKSMPALYNNWREYYKSIKNYDKAFEANDSAITWINRLYDLDYASISAQSLAQVQFDRQIANIQDEAKQHRTMMWIFAIGLVISIAFIFYVIRNIIRVHRLNDVLDANNSVLAMQTEELVTQNEKLNAQRIELANQNDKIEEANKEMTASIRYAEMIQKSAFPSRLELKKLFGDCLLLHFPLNIVSGDFYWAAQSEHVKLIAVGDCTGHGVPGAFMSMLGISTLNDVAKTTPPEKVSAADILNYMRSSIKLALHQEVSQEGNNDGMDMALVLLDEKRRQVHFAGALRPIIVSHTNEDGSVTLKKYDGDRMPIGKHIIDDKSFTDHCFDMCPGDVIYMFTDGVVDQFGYTDDNTEKKFTMRRLRETLTKMANAPFSEQEHRLVGVIHDWRRKKNSPESEPAPQTDDALMVAIRIQ